MNLQWLCLCIGAPLFFLIAGVSGETQDSVKIFTFQRGLWHVPNTLDYIKYDFNQSKILTDFTICYRLRLESFSRLVPHLSYSTSKTNTNALIFESMGVHIIILHDSKALPTQHLKPLEMYPETWNHFCQILEDSVYTIYWQGEEFLKADIDYPGLPLNGTLVVGQEQDDVGGGFAAYEILRGDVTQFSVWDYPLSPTRIKELNGCVDSGRGNVFSLDSDQMQSFGGVRLQTIELQDICKSMPFYVVVTDELSWDDGSAQCSLLGAEMAVPQNAAENNHLKASLDPFVRSCNSSKWLMWLGITDEKEEGVFMDVNTQQPITFTNHDLDSSGGEALNCLAILASGRWGGGTCSIERCIACHVPRSSYLYLRGLCFKDEHQMRFRMAGYSDGRILFRGYHEYVILWNGTDKKWRLLNTIGNTTVAHNTENNYPLGKKSWVIDQATCNFAVGNIVNLSLSSCKPGQFMCSSGICIKQHLRCDLKYDCLDGSDEDECQVVVVKKGYRKYLPPKGKEKASLQITPLITLNRINEVSDINKIIDIELRIQLTWSDAQLSFKHLDSRKITPLTNSETEKIWLPRYQLVNVKGGEAQVQSTSVAVAAANNETNPKHNSVDMDVSYAGVNHSISVIRQHIERFTCEFKLYSYPFDVQECGIIMQLLPSYSGNIQFNHKEGQVVYTGPQQLTLYTIHSPEYIATNDSSLLTVKFRLYRRQGFIILSTFLPSILLLAVSWATLFVRIQDLNVRAALSLTTLLVLFTLFSNTSRTLPTTATIKLIDVWFTFIIVLLFSNIIVHIFVARKPETPVMVVKTPPPPLQNVPVPRRCNCGFSLSLRFLRIYRLYVIPVIVLVFMVVFITICTLSDSSMT